MYHLLNFILTFIIIISIIYCFIYYPKSKNEELFKNIILNPGYNKVSISSDFNPFHTYIEPSKLDYLINVPKEYDTNASRSWLANKTFYCSQYNRSNTTGAPTMPQECPDSSFTYVDRIGDFVQDDKYVDLNYPGCIQLKEGSNYCYSDMFGNYKPNVNVLNHRSS
jgi:hypothetical protein